MGCIVSGKDGGGVMERGIRGKYRCWWVMDKGVR